MPWTSSSGSGRPPARRTCAASSGATSGSSAAAAGQPGVALHDRPIGRLAFSADGALLASGAEDGTIVLSGLDRPGPRTRPPRTPRTGHGPDILPRWEAPGLGVLGRGPLGRAVGPGHGAGTMAAVRSLSSIRDVAFAADGKIMVTLGERAATLWDTITGEIQSRIPLPEGSDMGMALAPDGRTLVTGGARR